MYRALAISFVALLVVAAPGCHRGSSARVDDENMRAYIAQLESIRDTLTAVNDVDAAKEASGKLATLQMRMQTIRADMGKLSSDLQRDVSVRYGETIVSLTREIAAQSRRIAQRPELSEAFGNSLDGLARSSPVS